MPFDQFFPIVAMGAMTVVAAILAWTVKEVVNLTQQVSNLGLRQDAAERENHTCAEDRNSLNGTLTLLQRDIAVITERTFHQTKSIEEIKNAVVKAPARRSRSGD